MRSICCIAVSIARFLSSAIAAAAKEVAEIISQRQTWRDRINELEAMEPDQPEAPQE